MRGFIQRCLNPNARNQMNRSAVIDTIKALASQVIVLHHLSLYTPMTDWIAMAWPRLVEFIEEDGRLAVQPFLVIGGFLAAQSVSKQRGEAIAPLIWKRYLRLAPQLGVALILVVLATLWLGSELSNEDWLSPLPSIGVFLAHLFFLQDVLGIPSMSAGAWYVAIDMQLFGLFVMLAHVAHKFERPLSESFAPAIVAIATMASIHVFSREPALDVWAIYYLSAYGLGALVAWSRDSSRARRWLVVTVVLLLLDWFSDPRARPALALITSFSLHALSHIKWHHTVSFIRKGIQYLSDVSYSMFVSHFAVIIIVSGLWEKFDLEGMAVAWLFVALAWLAALAVGVGVQWVCDTSRRQVVARWLNRRAGDRVGST
ncbi:acyltransferase family protein [bacterium BD-1]|nr:acyltransferase family protein [Ottowia caeni]